MATLYTQQSKNISKTWLLMGVFFAIVIGIGFFFSQYYGNPNILYIFVIFSIVMNIASYWYSDKIALKLNHAKQIKKEDNRELWNIVENLSITAGLPMPKLYIIDDLAPNAFATGRNKEHSVIAVTKGLLQILNRNEIEGVIAHEFSHIGNKDILISTIIIVLVGFVTLLSDFFLRMSIYGRVGGREGDDRAKIFMMLIGIALAILAPLIAILIQLAISRKREFLADASGALLTRYPEGLASALGKISNHSSKMRYANKATAHLFIVNPFGARGNLGKKVANLFSTHPRVEDRIKVLVGR